LALIIYVVLAIGGLSAIPQEVLIRDKEYALAAGASNILGGIGQFIVIFGALLATSSAISGTLFGSSRLINVIANDGYFPKFLTKRNSKKIPVNSIWTMGCLSFLLILTGSLQVILEFGSITFIIVSVLMAMANYKMRRETKTHGLIALIAIISLSLGGLCLLYYEFITEISNLIYIFGLYGLLLLAAFVYAKLKKN
jgi:amino acid transporter